MSLWKALGLGMLIIILKLLLPNVLSGLENLLLESVALATRLLETANNLLQSTQI